MGVGHIIGPLGRLGSWMKTFTEPEVVRLQCAWRDEMLKSILQDGDGFVYYARLESGNIKIGYSSSEELLLQRLRYGIPTSYGLEVVELLALERGGFLLEQQRQQQFQTTRLPHFGEQFRMSDDLRTHIRHVFKAQDLLLRDVITTIFPDQIWLRGGLVSAPPAYEVFPPSGQGPEFFNIARISSEIQGLDQVPHAGYRETQDCLQLLVVPRFLTAVRRIELIKDFLLSEGCTIKQGTTP